MKFPKIIFHKKAALPDDHGSWVFLLSPLMIGLFAGGSLKLSHLYLSIALLAIFFLRQPASTLVKTFSNRTSRKLRPAALFWLVFYGLIAIIGVVQLINLGFSFLGWLAVPGMLVFGWHLWLVSQRRERRQMGVDIIAAGSLALAAPAAFWITAGGPAQTGWWLWLLTWLQSAASIVYAFLRLEQRVLKTTPAQAERWKMGRRAILYSSFNFLLAGVTALLGWLPALIWLPYMIQLAETLWGTSHPAVSVRPTRIGLRQLVVSTLFTLAFILIWQPL